MSERMTRANLEERAKNLNRRIESTGRKVIVQGRNGYWGLDEYAVEHDDSFPARFNIPKFTMLRTITTGTKREVGDFLHAMMVGIDLSRVDPPAVPFTPFEITEEA
jgi:hypothetical protein